MTLRGRPTTRTLRYRLGAAAYPLAAKLAKLSRLGLADRWLLLQAATWLLAVDLGLRTLGFARVRDLLEGRGRPSTPPGDAASWRCVERMTTAVAVAARHHLYPMKCVVRSLALQHLLSRRGIASDLRIGVRREDERYGAHAWIECGGRPLAETEDVGLRFAALTLPRP